MEFTIASLLPSFLDPSIYVVPLYGIVTRGVNSSRVESGFARFARSTTKIARILYSLETSKVVTFLNGTLCKTVINEVQSFVFDDPLFRSSWSKKLIKE